MKKVENVRILIALGLIVVAMLTRLLPHPGNFTPILAIAMFSGALLGKKWFAFVVPMAVMLFTDIFIGFHETMWAVYLSFAIIVMMGMYFCKKIQFKNVFLTALLSAVLFFVVTNFACWLQGWYGYTFVGLIDCYVMAIPFFRMTLLSTFVYAFAFWGIYELATRKIFAIR